MGNRNIRRWLNEHSKYVAKYRADFPKFDLTPDSSELLYSRYKEAYKVKQQELAVASYDSLNEARKFKREAGEEFDRMLFNVVDQEAVSKKKVKHKIKKVIRTTLFKKSTETLKAYNTTFDLVNSIPMNEDNVSDIIDYVIRVLRSHIENGRKFPHGSRFVIRLLFNLEEDGSGEDGTEIININSEHSEEDLRILLEEKLSERLQRQFASEDYISYLVGIGLDVLPQSKTTKIKVRSTKGGCDSDKHVKTINYGKDKIVIESVKSIGGNCGIMCFIKAFGLDGTVVKIKTVRKNLCLPPKGDIDVKELPRILEYFNSRYSKMKPKGLVVIDGNKNIIAASDKRVVSTFIVGSVYANEDYVRIMLDKEHYSLFTWIPFVGDKKCPDCGTVYKKVHTKCDVQRMSFAQNVINKFEPENRIINTKNLKKEKESDYDNELVPWDIETSPMKKEKGVRYTGMAIPYANKFLCEGRDYLFEGVDNISQFVDVMMTMKNKVIIAYNGSRFDFHFLVKELIKRKIEIENCVLNSGKLMSFIFGNNIRVFDLNLFIVGSLRKACESFKLSVQKGDFDHKKIKRWSDVVKYRNEWRPYLDKDVDSMFELIKVFNRQIHKLMGVNIFSFITLSQLAYEYWINLDVIPNGYKIYRPKRDEYDFIKQGTYGARCYPRKTEYKSEHYDKVVSGEMGYSELIESKKFIFNADASSLYPAAMTGVPKLGFKPQYPVGPCRWGKRPENDFNLKKVGYYKIRFTPPTDLMEPILPRKEGLSIRWNLLPGEGVYPHLDIVAAMNHGYKIDFIGDCLVWDESAYIFDNYVNKLYQVKCEAEKEGNSAMKEAAKLMLNALYGKQLQKAIHTEKKFCYNLKELNDFCEDKIIDEMIPIGDNCVLAAVKTIEDDYDKDIRKPSQNGGLILAASRHVMRSYMELIDPTLKRLIFTYTDTDSLHLMGDDYDKLNKMGLITTKENASIGLLCSDIKNEGLIIHEINQAPKNYKYGYINNKGEVKTNKDATMKCKGIPQGEVIQDFYDGEAHLVEFDSMKKVHTKLSKMDLKMGVEMFSIKHVDCKRTVNKTVWSGMCLIDGIYYPWGHDRTVKG